MPQPQSVAFWLCRNCRARNSPSQVFKASRRQLQISSTPATTPGSLQEISPSVENQPSSSPDARFEVLGSPFSLLSVSLSASQSLYTRRGTLVGISGKAENAVSTLSLLEPFRRLLFGIPFLYQRIHSTTSLTALISAKSLMTSFSVVHLDGTMDWMVAQRDALLAWTGYTLNVRPAINTKMSLAHWGNTEITGRGLIALVGRGQIYQVALKEGEEYVIHPSNILAYTVTSNPPLPYRLKSTSLRLQVPNVMTLLPDTRFFRVMRDTQTFKTMAQILFHLRTWARRSILGDRLFVRFYGPSTILVQSRGSRLTDVLTARDVNEIADTPAGAVQSAVTLISKKKDSADLSSKSSHESTPEPSGSPATRVIYASVDGEGKVKFQKS